LQSNEFVLSTPKFEISFSYVFDYISNGQIMILNFVIDFLLRHIKTKGLYLVFLMKMHFYIFCIFLDFEQMMANETRQNAGQRGIQLTS
jgi:hypothetical protein